MLSSGILRIASASLAVFLAMTALSHAATYNWSGRGVSTDASNDQDLNRKQNYSPNLPDDASTHDVNIVFSSSHPSNSSDANLFSTAAYSVQNLTISNTVARVLNLAHIDSILFTNATTLSSNLVVRAMGGANNYALNVTFNTTLSARNVSFGGAALGATPGRTATATLTFGGSTSIISNLTFTGNTGRSTLNISGPTTIGRDLTFTGGAGTNILNITGATTVSNNVSFVNTSGSASNRVSISSTLTALGNFTNSSRVILNNGHVSAVNVRNTGTISGSGTLTGNVVNDGVLSPGLSVGKFTVVGNLALGGTSIVFIELDSISSFDKIEVTGDMTFGGTLNVINATSFTLNLGDSFKIFTFNSAQGTFSAINLPTLTGDLSWDTSQLGIDGTIVVIPEPSAIALVLTGICGLCVASRIRRTKPRS